MEGGGNDQRGRWQAEGTADAGADGGLSVGALQPPFFLHGYSSPGVPMESARMASLDILYSGSLKHRAYVSAIFLYLYIMGQIVTAMYYGLGSQFLIFIGPISVLLHRCKYGITPLK